MSNALEFALISVCIQFLAVVFFWFIVIRKNLQMAHVYPLYAIRDKLIYLVASGKLQEGDFLFQEFYKAVNIVIPNSRRLTFNVLVRSIEEARQKGHDPAVSQKVIRIQKELEKVDDEVRSVVAEFYQSVMLLFVYNSIALRLLSKLFSSPLVTTRFRREAWSFYSDYRQAHTLVVCPA
jgi:hypothetical protein